jgi:hypothetical protein
MYRRRPLFVLLVYTFLITCVTADQIVLLDRPTGSTTFEPFFNPKTVNANIGELIHFVANFEPLSAVS